MVEAMVEKSRADQAENAELRDQLERLQVENERLRSQLLDLRAALDAHLARVASTPMYGSPEMTAGTCVGPRRSRGMPRGGSTA